MVEFKREGSKVVVLRGQGSAAAPAAPAQRHSQWPGLWLLIDLSISVIVAGIVVSLGLPPVRALLLGAALCTADLLKHWLRSRAD